MKKHLSVVFTLVLLGLATATMAIAQTQDEKSIVRVSGADSMFNRIRVLSKVFMNAHPTIKINFTGGEYVDIGIQDLLEGKSDIAMASRQLTPKENEQIAKSGVELVERLIGYGGIIIIVNPANPVDELTVDQVKKIFKGEYTRWDQVGGGDQSISVVRQDDSQHPGTFIFMQDQFLGAPFIEKSIALATFPSIMNKVAAINSAIGFVRQRDAFESPIAKKAQVKVVKIKRTPALVGIMPSREALADGSYPLRRPYYLYYSNKANSDVLKFADFIVSKGWGAQDL
jgi:phosphate transport system substrate-binding protein